MLLKSMDIPKHLSRALTRQILRSSCSSCYVSLFRKLVSEWTVDCQMWSQEANFGNLFCNPASHANIFCTSFIIAKWKKKDIKVVWELYKQYDWEDGICNYWVFVDPFSFSSTFLLHANPFSDATSILLQHLLAICSLLGKIISNL